MLKKVTALTLFFSGICNAMHESYELPISSQTSSINLRRSTDLAPRVPSPLPKNDSADNLLQAFQVIQQLSSKNYSKPIEDSISIGQVSALLKKDTSKYALFGACVNNPMLSSITMEAIIKKDDLNNFTIFYQPNLYHQKIKNDIFLSACFAGSYQIVTYLGEKESVDINYFNACSIKPYMCGPCFYVHTPTALAYALAGKIEHPDNTNYDKIIDYLREKNACEVYCTAFGESQCLNNYSDIMQDINAINSYGLNTMTVGEAVHQSLASQIFALQKIIHADNADLFRDLFTMCPRLHEFINDILIIACGEDALAIITYLLHNHRKNININYWKSTPHETIKTKTGNYEIRRKTALDMAQQNHYYNPTSPNCAAIIKLLLQYGAKKEITGTCTMSTLYPIDDNFILDANNRVWGVKY